MKKGYLSLFLAAAILLVFAAFAVQCTKTDTQQQGANTNKGPQQEATTNTGPQQEATPNTEPQVTTQVREMTVTGVIAEGYNSYVIQGKTPSTMIWTILNPEPKVLDEHVRTGKTVKIDVWIVSGDNVNILTIDGQNYPKTSKK